jgi:hypothetical protein
MPMPCSFSNRTCSFIVANSIILISVSYFNILAQEIFSLWSLLSAE